MLTRYADLKIRTDEARQRAIKERCDDEILSLFKHLRSGDGRLWSDQRQDLDSIASRCGWFLAPERMLSELEALETQLRDAVPERYDHIVLLGMGGSSAFAHALVGLRERNPDRFNSIPCTVLDSLCADQVQEVRTIWNRPNSLIIVASKSGGTTETRTLASLAEQDGVQEKMIAVTDPGSPLERHARESGYALVVHGWPDVGGRFSAMTPFGIVPAILMGLDARQLLKSAKIFSDGQEFAPTDALPSSIALSGALASVIQSKSDIVTVELGPLQPLSIWLEQLLAESIGKSGTNFCPIATPSLHQLEGNTIEQRPFAHVHYLAPNETLERLPEHCQMLMTLACSGIDDLGAELMRWQITTAGIGALLKLNPFNEPDVGIAKTRTAEGLDSLAATGSLPWPDCVPSSGPFSIWTSSQEDNSASPTASFLRRCAREHGLLNLLLFIPDTQATQELVERVCFTLTKHQQMWVNVGVGPRYLHSTGQLHKGGLDQSGYIILTVQGGPSIPLPGEAQVCLDQLAHIQAIADAQVLSERKRDVLFLRSRAPAQESLAALQDLFERALTQGR